MGIQLQERDKEILKIMHEQQFLLLSQVRDYFFNGNRFEASRRIGKLEKSGHLERMRNPMTSKMSVLRPLPLGAEIAQFSGAIPVQQSRKIHESQILHDSIVTEVRLRLSEIWKEARFIPEWNLRLTERAHQPDGIFDFGEKGAIAIEVENSAKGKTRFISILDQWRDWSDVFFVLYVVTSRELEAKIRNFIKEANPEIPIGTVYWTDWSERPLVWSTRGDIDLFRGGLV